MARPKTEESQETPVTEHVPAPTPVNPTATYSTPVPPVFRVERTGARSEPYTRRFPRVLGGVCEFCGTLDPNVEPQNQYRLCPHFRNVGQLMCSYCPETKSPEEVVRQESLNVAVHPDHPNQLVVWCGSYECSAAHLKRFKISR